MILHMALPHPQEGQSGLGMEDRELRLAQDPLHGFGVNTTSGVADTIFPEHGKAVQVPVLLQLAGERHG